MERFLLFFIFFFLINAKDTTMSFKYRISDIISLLKSNKNQGYKIIDPNNYINYEDEKVLSETLEDIYKKYKIVSFIIVFHSPYLKDDNNADIDLLNYTNSLKEEIYAQKIVEKKVPIIVAVISIEEKIMSMGTEGNVSKVITEQDCYNILSVINNYFSYGEYSYGSVELGKLISYYLANTGFFSRNKQFFYMIILLIACFCICYLLAVVAKKIKERRNLRLTMSDEEKLLKIREFLKKTRSNRKILSENCIICLEPFDNCTSIIHTISHDNQYDNQNTNQYNSQNNQNDNNLNKKNSLLEIENDTILTTNFNTNSNTDRQLEMQTINNDDAVLSNSTITDNQISTLACGHRYHVKCITEWMLQKKNICPMCRERIDIDLPENEDEDLQNELLNIQIDLHPVFALLVFQTINEELTWGAMALPAINGGFFSGLAGFAFL